MCNEFHQESKYNPRKIKPSGTAWKVFEERDGVLLGAYSLCNYTEGPNGFIVWNEKCTEYTTNPKLRGFCAFPLKSDAQETAKELDNVLNNLNLVIKRVHYKQGIGRITTNEVDGRLHDIIIIKQFKVLD